MSNALVSPTLYLASRSPRRAQLIRLLGVRNVRISPSDVDETMENSSEPELSVILLAERKAKATAAFSTSVNGVVLGADTVVSIDNTILNKPQSDIEAAEMLRMLSNRTHTVYTGVSLLCTGAAEFYSFAEATKVTFRSLSEEEITRYVASGSPMDKAGAYGIQEDFGAVFVSRIDGDYYNVVGLPVSRVYVELRRIAPELFSM